jgi:hypothetical protein
MADVQPINQGAIMASGQALVPDWARQELERKLGALQTKSLALQNTQAQQQIDAANAAKAAEQGYQDDVATAWHDGSPGAIGGLMVKHPKRAEEIKKAWDVKDEAERRVDLRQMGEIYSAGQGGQWELAAKTMRRRYEADKAAGKPDPQDEAILAALESGDPNQRKAAMGMVGMTLASIAGEDHFGTVYGALTKGSEGFTLGQGQTRYDAEGKPIASVAPKADYLVVPEGGKAVPINGAPALDMGGGGQASGGPGGNPNSTSGAPRSVRNNNPGNLKTSAFTKSLPGYTGTDSGGFAVFESPQAGAAAQGALLSNYIDRGFNTIGKIIGRWAPPTDNNDTAAYVRNVAKELGVNPGDTVTKAIIPRLQAAIARVEGGPGASSGAAAQAGQGDPAGTLYGTPKKGYQLLTPDENVANGLDPNVRYQRGPDGNITAIGGQSKAQLKPIPASVGKEIITNRGTLRQIDSALAELTRNPGAIGPTTGMVGDQFTNWRDPKGVALRAAIGKIGGQIIHDVSGAAVTLSEEPRFRPYVPLITDPPGVARQKLMQLKQLTQGVLNDYADQYSEEQGYRSFGGKSGGDQPVKVRTVQEAMKLPKGTVFITPDGRRKVRP